MSNGDLVDIFSARKEVLGSATNNQDDVIIQPTLRQCSVEMIAAGGRLDPV